MGRTCVAQALLITCCAKNTFPLQWISGTDTRASASFLHLKRKISPYTGLQCGSRCR